MQVTGNGGVPSDGVRAVVFDLEMVGATTGTDLVTYATGASRPAISTAVTGAGSTVIYDWGDFGYVLNQFRDGDG